MRSILWLVRILAVVLIALHVAAPWLPEASTWGIFPFTYLPTAVRWGAGALGLALCIGPANAAVRRALSRLAEGWPRRLEPRLGYAAFSVLMAVPFWLGRIVHTRWGDAYILVNAIPSPDARLTFSWQAPLDVFLHAKAWALAHRLWGWDAMTVYGVLSTLAGVGFIFLLLMMADDLGRDRAERATLVGLIGTLGLMQFFFGYVENYVFMSLGVLTFLWLGMRHLAGRTTLAVPASVLALTHAFHPSTVLALDASMLYLWLARAAGSPLRSLRSRLRAGVSVAAPMAAVFGLVLVVMQLGGHGVDALLGADFPGGGDRSWFVPLATVSSRWQHYTMFSLAHLADIVNEQILVAPFSLALVLGSLATAAGRRVLRDQPGRFLALAAAGYLLLTLVWNADYGGRRDWDLFAPAALPLTMLASHLLIGVEREERCAGRPGHLGEIVLIVAGVSAIFTAAWVYSNTIPWSWGAGT